MPNLNVRLTGTRLEDRLYEQLDWRIPLRPRANELLGDQMIQAGLEMGPNTPYGEYSNLSLVYRHFYALYVCVCVCF